MAKFAALVLLLVAAVACSASAYTTVVTTTMSDESCQSEMEQMMPMKRCMMYMKSQMRGNNRRYEREGEDDLEKCCSEIRQFSSECRCDAVKEMMMKMPHLEMQRVACSLPIKCRMSPCACPRLFA